jgi:5-methylcytosine-specific restriction endonuclease McrA
MAVEQPTTKTCTKCAETKPLSAYGKSNLGKYGLRSYCKACRMKDYYAKVEHHRAVRKLWYEKNKKVQNARCLANYYANKVKWHERSKRWAKANWTKVLALSRSQCAKRRAAKNASGGAHTNQDIQQLLQLQRYCCAVCKSKLGKYHVDHVVPLLRGGTNDRLNLQILCQPCNQKKHAKDPVRFMQEMGYLL